MRKPIDHLQDFMHLPEGQCTPEFWKELNQSGLQALEAATDVLLVEDRRAPIERVLRKAIIGIGLFVVLLGAFNGIHGYGFLFFLPLILLPVCLTVCKSSRSKKYLNAIKTKVVTRELPHHYYSVVMSNWAEHCQACKDYLDQVTKSDRALIMADYLHMRDFARQSGLTSPNPESLKVIGDSVQTTHAGV